MLRTASTRGTCDTRRGPHRAGASHRRDSAGGGQVSATIAVSARTPTEVKGGRVQADSRHVDLQTVAVTMSGVDSGRTELLLPVRLRSNAAYALSASVRAKGASLVSVSVTSTRATGRFVAEGAVDAIKIAEGIDSRTQTPPPEEHPERKRPSYSSTPVVLLTGPSISTAGTLSSPDNAIEVNLSLIVKASVSKEPWELELVLSAGCVE